MSTAGFWLRWLVLALVGGAALWFALPEQRVATALATKPADRWALPEIPRWQLPLSAPALIAGSPIWGGAPTRAEAAEAAVPPDPRWRLAGVLGASNERRLLVSFMDAGKPPSLLRVGDQLPSGHRIVRIDEREVCVALGKRSYILGLESLDTAPRAD